MVDAGLKTFSTDKPFPPEPVERPGIEHAFAGDEHGKLTITDPSRAPRLGERIEFFPPHCDPTMNLYDRVYVVRGAKVEAVWEIAARGRSDSGRRSTPIAEETPFRGLPRSRRRCRP